jgi:hypothetical protein
MFALVWVGNIHARIFSLKRRYPAVTISLVNFSVFAHETLGKVGCSGLPYHPHRGDFIQPKSSRIFLSCPSF